MKVAERMQRDGWRQYVPMWWTRRAFGVEIVIGEAGSKSAFIILDGFKPDCDCLILAGGLFDLAQRAKAAARKLARKRRTQ